MATDYYELLGVGHDATEDELKRAYRQTRPRASPGLDRRRPRGGAAVQGDDSLAYEVLRDPERRRRYDMFGPDGVDARTRTWATCSAGTSATCSVRSSAGARALAAAIGSGAGSRRGDGARPELPRGGLRRLEGDDGRHDGLVLRVRRERCEAGHHGHPLRRLRRSRRGPPGPPVDSSARW